MIGRKLCSSRWLYLGRRTVEWAVKRLNIDSHFLLCCCIARLFLSLFLIWRCRYEVFFQWDGFLFICCLCFPASVSFLRNLSTVYSYCLTFDFNHSSSTAIESLIMLRHCWRCVVLCDCSSKRLIVNCAPFFFVVVVVIVYLPLEPTWYRNRNRNYFPQWSEYVYSKSSPSGPLPPPPKNVKWRGCLQAGVCQLSVNFHIFSLSSSPSVRFLHFTFFPWIIAAY